MLYNTNINSHQIRRHRRQQIWLLSTNIVVQDQDQDTFFDRPLPNYSGFSGFIEKEEIIIPRKFSSQLVYDVEITRKDMDAPTDAEWSFDALLRNLLQFMYLDLQKSPGPYHC